MQSIKHLVLHQQSYNGPITTRTKQPLPPMPKKRPETAPIGFLTPQPGGVQRLFATLQSRRANLDIQTSHSAVSTRCSIAHSRCPNSSGHQERGRTCTSVDSNPRIQRYRKEIYSPHLLQRCFAGRCTEPGQGSLWPVRDMLSVPVSAITTVKD